ncbi:MAG: hypothetical protein GY940_21100 [bacterium]|nr:hypothetical protein [bacterium]
MSVKPVQEVIRTGLEELLRAVLEKEMDEFIRKHRDDIGPGGLKEIVRNGYHKERAIQCSVGAVRVAVPRSRDRGKRRKKKITFQSRIIPRYMRRVDELDALIPTLYLEGLLSGDFSDIFSLLLGEADDPLLPVSAVEELKAQWETGAGIDENPGWGYWNIGNPTNGDWGYWNSGSPWWAGSGIWWSFGGSFSDSSGFGGYPANDYHVPWELHGPLPSGKWETSIKPPPRQRHRQSQHRRETTATKQPATMSVRDQWAKGTVTRVSRQTKVAKRTLLTAGQKVEAQNHRRK